MASFDAPNQEVCTLRRSRTNTPLQALVTLNDPVFVEAAQALARRMATSGNTPAERARFGFRQCVSRQPTEAELSRLVALYQAAYDRFSTLPEDATKLATDPLGPAPEGANVAELAAWTVVSNVLLNLDEMFMKR
jgi:alkanesulfonate monooxygenase SsuD/methylene tetrahydromethanopterin reductase-like flavin-dependent oxidoreductase (luciferase family)